MNEYEIDANVRRRYVREAEQMRSELLRGLFVTLWKKTVQLGAWIGKHVRSLRRRSRLNLSVPAPHR